ncbi:MAG: dienelactone hydrolase family protein [Novosphingobium sp.]|nr:dienelactone hydrolase family protein [Novosphingobium sp.]
MTDRVEAVTTTEGTMEVFVAHPESDGPWPVVVQLMDGIGMREELCEHARRTASWGYYVIAPDLYYRWGFKGPLDFSNAEERDKIMGAIGSLTAEKATSDVEAALGLADADPAAKNGSIGLYGFCMGGKLTLEIAQTLGERVAAGASIHPGSLVTDAPSSPHRHLDRVAAELYFGIADNDDMANPEQMAQLVAQLGARHIAFQLEWHPGALHGYMMPSRADLHHHDAAEKVWGRMEELFARALQ